MGRWAKCWVMDGLEWVISCYDYYSTCCAQKHLLTFWIWKIILWAMQWEEDKNSCLSCSPGVRLIVPGSPPCACHVLTFCKDQGTEGDNELDLRVHVTWYAWTATKFTVSKSAWPRLDLNNIDQRMLSSEWIFIPPPLHLILRLGGPDGSWEVRTPNAPVLAPSHCSTFTFTFRTIKSLNFRSFRKLSHLL